jgi:hypothetical protein
MCLSGNQGHRSSISVVILVCKFITPKIYINKSNRYTTCFRVKRLNNWTRKLVKPWYEWFVTWSHAISHLGRWFLHGYLRIIKLQSRFKVCNISYDICVYYFIDLCCCLHKPYKRQRKKMHSCCNRIYV